MDTRNQTDVAFQDGTDQDGMRVPLNTKQFPGDKMPQGNKVQKKHKKKHISHSRHKEHR